MGRGLVGIAMKIGSQNAPARVLCHFCHPTKKLCSSKNLFNSLIETDTSLSATAVFPFFDVLKRTPSVLTPPTPKRLNFFTFLRAFAPIPTWLYNSFCVQCQGVLASGTTFITFDDVRVPSRNLIGEENDGFRMIMHNFNHERWGILIMANRLARVALADAFELVFFIV